MAHRLNASERAPARTPFTVSQAVILAQYISWYHVNSLRLRRACHVQASSTEAPCAKAVTSEDPLPGFRHTVRI